LTVGILARVWSVSYGLPDVYHPDEPRIVERAVRFHTGDLNPRFFNWPSLYMYLLSGVYGLAYGMLGVGGAEGIGGVVESFARDPAPFYLLGRLVTAAFGIATIAVLYVVAAESYGPTVALLASLFLALNLLHIRDSHFITTDVPLTCLITLAVLFVLRYWREGRARDALWSGLFAGLAASMKYPGGLMLFPFVLAHVFRPLPLGQPRRRRLASRELALGVAAASVGFVAGTPYALLTPRAFVAGVTSELREVGSVQFGNEGDLPGYLFHLVHSLPEGMGVPVLACSLIGLALALLGGAPRDLILLAFPVPYFLLIGSWSSRFERYALPLLPFLSLLAGLGLVAMARHVRERRWRLVQQWRPGVGLALMACLLIAPELPRIGYFHALLARPDTRVLAAAWIEREIPPGSRIALEPYSPSLPLAPVLSREAPQRGYRIGRLSPYDLDTLLDRQVEYVVLSGFMFQRHEKACDHFSQECRFYRDVQQRGTLLLALEPGLDGQPLWVGDIYSPLTRLYERTRPGPSMKVYRLPLRRDP